jgi:glycosyltransferase involved in cell wall biosynthesis
MNVAVPRVGFVLEQTLGHITHADNLRRLVPGSGIEPIFESIPFDLEGWAARVPGFGNWTVRSGIRARRAIRRLRRAGIDALYIHTQVPATLVPDLVGKLPSVVSLDATPRQYDALGEFYSHSTGGRLSESAKRVVHRLCLSRAEHLVTWSAWTKAGLVNDYGVPADKVTVIPPGVDIERWTAVGSQRARRDDRVLRVLFVGGDFARKGGPTLLEAVTTLRRRGTPVEVDLVTKSAVTAPDGVRVRTGMSPNDPDLIALYNEADVFCLPTLGDCLPMVLSEAGAVGLPLVSTDVGAINEIVRDGETGLLVTPGDAGSLTDALGVLATDEALRQRLGTAAQTMVRERFDAASNARRLAELMLAVAGTDPAV